MDVHRLFPGLGASPEAAFDALWSEHIHLVIAGRSVPVPSPRHQRLVVIVHAARDPFRGGLDVRHIRESLPAESWAALREEAHRLDAGAAWHVATGEAAARDLDWQMRHSLEDMVRTAWEARSSKSLS